jgi:hypothetical protein
MTRVWPDLEYAAWQDTYATLHMWTQIVGKIALKLNPLINHWWECSLRVTARGLKTTLIAYKEHSFDMTFDFIDHRLLVEKSDGSRSVLTLEAKPVAQFYAELMATLRKMNIEVEIDVIPSEVPQSIPFPEDFTHQSYDPIYAHRHWLILREVDKLLTKFRSHFLGKASPVEFFWGTFDLTVAVFSGKRAPELPRANHIDREAYSHEVVSCGFWPGSGNILQPAFYGYVAPQPKPFREGPVQPSAAFYNSTTSEFILKYEDAKRSPNPEVAVLSFFNSIYELGANLGGWDRGALERDLIVP